MLTYGFLQNESPMLSISHSISFNLKIIQHLKLHSCYPPCLKATLVIKINTFIPQAQTLNQMGRLLCPFVCCHYFQYCSQTVDFRFFLIPSCCSPPLPLLLNRIQSFYLKTKIIKLSATSANFGCPTPILDTTIHTERTG